MPIIAPKILSILNINIFFIDNKNKIFTIYINNITKKKDIIKEIILKFLFFKKNDIFFNIKEDIFIVNPKYKIQAIKEYNCFINP